MDYDGAHDFNNMGMLARRPALVQARGCLPPVRGVAVGLTLR